VLLHFSLNAAHRFEGCQVATKPIFAPPEKRLCLDSLENACDRERAKPCCNGSRRMFEGKLHFIKNDRLKSREKDLLNDFTQGLVDIVNAGPVSFNFT
jgi:hypothetical protein